MKLAAAQTREHLENKWSRGEAAHVVAQTQEDMQEKPQVHVHSMSQQIPQDVIHTHTHTHTQTHHSDFNVCKRK